MWDAVVVVALSRIWTRVKSALSLAATKTNFSWTSGFVGPLDWREAQALWGKFCVSVPADFSREGV
jgi:hypothetical protein